MFGIKSVQTRRLKQPWQQTQLTLGREIAEIATGMVWHDQHMPLMGLQQKEPFKGNFSSGHTEEICILFVMLVIPFYSLTTMWN